MTTIATAWAMVVLTVLVVILVAIVWSELRDGGGRHR